MVLAANTRPKRTGHPTPVKFDVGEFAQVIEDQGVFVKITPAMLCPNKDEVFSTNHELECTVCNGNEAVDIASQSIEEWAFIQAVDLKLDWRKEGILDIKDAREKAEEFGCDGVMLGRAIFGNPWLFDIKKSTVSIEEKLRVLVEHTKLF